jgi:hypothetical protein
MSHEPHPYFDLPQALSAWPGVKVAPSRFGGIEFTLATRELGYMYADGQLSLSFNSTIGQQLISDGKANSHPLYPDTGWVSYEVCTQAQSYEALWLLKLAWQYHRIRYYRHTMTPELRATIEADLQALGLSAALYHLFEQLLAD